MIGYGHHTEYEEAYIHEGCNGKHHGFKFRPEFRTQHQCNKYYSTCTHGPAWYCDDDKDVSNLEIDDACIYRGCCSGEDPSSGGIHKCVKYDSNGVWVCNDHGQEESDEDEEDGEFEKVSSEETLPGGHCIDPA